MTSKLGWALVALAFAVGWWAYGWQGLLMALTVTVFWLLLQFSRALRVMKNAADSPVGHVAGVISRLDRERGAHHTPEQGTDEHNRNGKARPQEPRGIGMMGKAPPKAIAISHMLIGEEADPD